MIYSKGSYHDSHPDRISKIIRSLNSHARELDGGILGKADEVELSAFSGQTGQLADRTSTTHIPSLKYFVRRNHQSTFTIRVQASGALGEEVCSILGPPDFFERTEGQQEFHLQELAGERAAREVIFLASGEVSAWRGTTVRFPRNPSGRATLRDALVILIAPRQRTAPAHTCDEKVTTGQIHLRFE